MNCLRDENVDILFSDQSVDIVSQEITSRLRKTAGKYIIVPNDKVYNVLTQIFERNRTYGLGINIELRHQNMIQECMQDTIDFIVNEVTTTLSLEDYYNNLSKWDSILSTNNYGMRSHPQIKLNNIKTHNPRMGFMRY